jgi:hypothetical protein
MIGIEVRTWVTFRASGTVDADQLNNIRIAGSKIVILAAVSGDAANALYAAYNYRILFSLSLSLLSSLYPYIFSYSYF